MKDNIAKYISSLCFLEIFDSRKFCMRFHTYISKKLKSPMHKRRNNQYCVFWISLMDAVKRNKRKRFNSEEKLKVFVSFAHGFLYVGSLFVLSAWWQIWYVLKSFRFLCLSDTYFHWEYTYMELNILYLYHVNVFTKISQ